MKFFEEYGKIRMGIYEYITILGGIGSIISFFFISLKNYTLYSFKNIVVVLPLIEGLSFIILSELIFQCHNIIKKIVKNVKE